MKEKNINYIQADNNLRIKRSIIGCVLAIILVPAGVSLEYFIYPDSLIHFLKARITCSFLISIILALHYTKIGKKHIRILMFAWILLIQATLSYMIFTTDRYLSTYYAGLNLVVLAVAVVLPLSTLEMAVFCTATTAIYLAAAIIGIHIENFGILYNNLYFLTLTSIISITAVFFNSKARYIEFCLNHELKEKNNKLVAMDQMKSQFFASVSHELRTPLTLILGPIQDILSKQSSNLPENIRNIFNIIEQNGLRLLKLVNDLLDIIRLEEGKVDLRIQKIEINSFANGLTDGVQYLANLQKIILIKEIPNNPIFINVDANALEKIILNLLNNAIKFTPAGGSIVIRVNSDSKNAFFEIEDTGIGIKESDLPYIFDRFRQADSSTTRQYQGTGLGLALVKELTELQNGKVKVISEIGKGTKFTLEFPLYIETSAIEEESEEAKLSEEENSIIKMHKMAARVGNIVARNEEIQNLSDLEERKLIKSEIKTTDKPVVLVIDDEPDMRHYIVNLLKDEDYRVIQARDGDTGLKMARRYKPDLVVLDLMLPKIDGLEVCRTLKDDEETKLIKIIMLTARVDESAKITALKNSADDFLTKPFSGIELRGRTGNLLQNSRLQAEVHQRNTELQEAISRLRSTQAQLLQSEKINALGNLAAGLLHEVNNPLNYTMTALQLIKADPAINADADLKDTIKDISEGMSRIKTIVSDLRAFAYPTEADKKAKISVADVVTSAMRFTAHECKDIKMICNVPLDLDAFGSKTHIVQVLINLITNGTRAIAKTNRPGQITINAEPGDGRVVISVTDNGCGMDEETLRRVFDPFFTTSEVGKGMGLGLSVSHTIIKSHGGHFTATSKLGEGSTFYFDLPTE